MCACAMSGLMLATSCQDSMDLQTANSNTRAVVIDKDIFAVRGRINVKLEKGANQALPTSAKGNVELQSVPSAMSSAMKYAGAYKMERVFKPAGIYEERTIAEGLDRWYTIYFDESKDVAEVLQQFNKAAGVEYAERVLPIARPKFTAKPYIGTAPQTRNQPTASAFNDPLLAKQWHYYNDGSVSPHAKKGADCNLKPVWEKYTTGKNNVIVAIVDGGIDVTHEDLVDNLYINEKEKNGQAGVDDNGIGVAGVAGGNGAADSGVRLMSCQIFRGKDEQGDAAAAIKYAADNGAVICQNSWGYSSTSGVTAMPKLLKEAVDYFIKMAGCDANGQQRANSPMKGGVVIFAAGNENKDFAAYPACYPPAVSVSAMAWNFAKASYSNYADWVTIMAPGGDQDRFGIEGGILSTVPKSKASSGYAYFQGTSMACPHVSGIAALIASYFGRQGFTNDELKSRLITAYRPFNIDELNPAYKGKLGKGYIDAEAAFETDTKIAPEKVATLTLTPDFVDITAEWSIAKDEDKTAAFYRLYISPNDLTAENIKDMTFKEINGLGHSLGEKLRFTFDNLQDNKAYSIAVVAVDRWGNLSKPAIQKCTTKLNHAPEVTNFPEEVVELNNNERKTFSFKVADPDGHNWDIKAVGETKGVSYSLNQATVTVNLVPVLQAGSYTCTFVLTDDLGAKAEKSFTFKIVKYMPPKLEQPFANYIIGLDEGPVNISLKGHYTGSGSQLSYKANVANGGIASVQVSNDQLQIKPLARGVTRVSVLASDGRQTSSDGSFQVRIVEKKSAPVYAVYPIPAKKDINALLNPEVTQAEFVISSTVGEQLMSATVTPDKNSVATLDLSKLRPGTYKLTVHTSKGNHTQMFIKR